ncbi:hypothetical protein J6590_023366 [Homalodisca vitripennis]|nr:hypothetical protein J6590_023366 [Homalodisca vitripennis]
MSNRPVPPSPIVVSYSVLGSERMLAVSVPAWAGRCKAVWLSVRERMLAASVDYRHGLADVMQCGSQFSFTTVVLCSVGPVPAWPGRCKAVWLSVQWFTHCGPVLQCWVASGCWQSQYRHGLADVRQCGSHERMLAASVDYRHGLADVMQCGSQFSGLLTVVLCYSVGLSRLPSWPGRCNAVWLSVQWFTHCGPVLQCWYERMLAASVERSPDGGRADVGSPQMHYRHGLADVMQCGSQFMLGSERMLAASVDYRHGLADVRQCGSQFSVLGSERMLAASVDYRHGLADVMQCGSQFSGLLTVVLCYSVG